MHTRRRRIGIALVVAALCASPVTGGDALDLVPADSLFVWNGLPYPDTAPAGSQPSALATLFEAGARLAGNPLHPGARLAVRAAELFSLTVRYPFAISIIDAHPRAKEREVSRAFDKLQIALIVRTGGANDAFRRIVQRALNDLTDSGQASLERSTAEGQAFETLRDRRIEGVFAWGEIGEYFVLTFGEDAWPLVARAAAGRDSLGAARWVRDVRAQNPEPALIELYVAVREIRARLDPSAEGRATEFFRAWSADDIDQAAWFLGFEKRALFCLAHLRRGETMQRHVFADAKMADETALRLIPPDARYAVYQVPMHTLLPRLFGGFYSTRGARLKQAAIDVLERIEQKHGFNVQRDILERLGQRIILHNQPPHPLRLPLAFTAIIEIESDQTKVRERLDTLCGEWQSFLAAPREDEPRGASATLDREPDGVWSFRWGPLVGVAWTFTDTHIVASWSPYALRQVLDDLNDRARRR